MKFLKFLVLPAVALSLIGCDKAQKGDDSPACCEQKACTAEVARSPIAMSGMQVCIRASRVDAPALAPLAVTAKELFAQALVTLNAGDVDAKGVIEAVKASELLDSEPRWAQLEVGGINPEDLGKAAFVPDVVLACGVSHDFNKIVSAFKPMAEAASLKQEIAQMGPATVWTVTQQDEAEQVLVASVGGELLLVASKPGLLEKAIGLYLSGSSEAPETEKVVSLKVNDIGSLVKAVDEEQLTMLDAFLPDGKAMFQGLGSFELSLTAVDKASVKGVLQTRKPEDAASLGLLLNAMKGTFLSALTNSDDPMERELGGVLSSATINAEGADLKIVLDLPEAIVERIAANLKEAMTFSMISPAVDLSDED